MRPATKHEKDTHRDDLRRLQTRIYYDSEWTKLRLKHREVFLCSYGSWVFTDVEDIYPYKKYEN